LVPVILTLVMLSAAVPLLVSVTDCAALVLPTARLANVKLVGDSVTAGAVEPVPEATGVKVTLMVQVASGATLVTVVPQEVGVLVRAKSAASVPVRVMDDEVKVRVADGSVLVSVTVCAVLVVPTVWLAKVRLVGTNWTNVPVPLKATVCVLPETLPLLSVIVSVPLLVGGLDSFGVNVTLMLQFAPAATVVPQVFVSVNSFGSVVTTMLVMLSAPVPELVRVTASGDALA